MLLNDSTTLQLAAALPSGAGAVVFHGPTGVGKYTAAMELVRTRNCLRDGDIGCTCKHCAEFTAGNFPDLIIIRPEDKASIGVEQIRELVVRLSLSPYYEDAYRFVIIDSAEQLTHQAQNALLKLIEEPPPRTNVVLVATELESLLPTVRSRCRQVYFPTLSTTIVAAWLGRYHKVSPPQATDLAELAGGSAGLAVRYATDPDWIESVHATASITDDFFGSSLFKRLRMAKELSDQKGRYGVAITQLQRRARERILASNPNGAIELMSLERLQSQLAANVSPRSAFERFALGVGQ